MKKLKIHLLKRHNKLIGMMLSLLGFGAACTLPACEYGPPAVEYGTPHATFIVKGEVKSETSSSAIPNIRVVMNYDTAYTDASGKYQVETSDFPDDQAYLVEFRDVDGTDNGSYQPLDSIVEFVDPEFTDGTGSWDAGKTEKEVNIKMKSGK